ncbi:hypothetical protein BVG79_p1000167 (plasmid) [Ketogulonicigenium robustum]|uniref:Glucose-methanol-choline oxidoreductase C-terminal domain-containing protein n=1 Tax=Ketogulonicigenium robustum TaxID=92947 RepID=A0A1W6P3G7_9RHOB|nr:hypothetical protein BVG79_p1000167 [Ketogulonicigenium robustum]
MSNFDYRTNAEVIRVDMHPDGKSARGVTYINENGEEVFQPAGIVLLCAYQFYNVRLMLLSGIGKPYDFATGEGAVGRNYSFLSNGGLTLYYKDKQFNPFATAGATGVMFNDVSPRPGFTDGVKHGFIGGAKIHSSQATGNPIGTSLPPGTPGWGAGWKKGMADWYGRSMKISITTTCMSYRSNFMDLDPTYKDRYGNPLLRVTFDWKENEKKLQQYLRDICLSLKDDLQPDIFSESFMKEDAHYDLRPYVSTHTHGGAVMGETPEQTALNKYSQSWDAHNVFVVGGHAFPQNHQSNPTSMIGGMAYLAAKGIVEQYLSNPGQLVQA